MLGVVRKHVIRLAMAAFIVLLWSAPHLASRLQERTRYYALWERQDAWWSLAPILLYAVLAVVLAMLVDWSGRAWAGKAFRSMFLIALGGGVLANLVHQLAKLRPYPIPLLEVAAHFGWLVIAALAGYVFAHDRSRLLTIGKRLCLICSPGLLVVAIQLFGGHTYPIRTDPLPAAGADSSLGIVRTVSTAEDVGSADAPPIYWFIFDEWSYELTYQQGRLRAPFKNLNRFSQQAIVFHDAQSPGRRTEVSIPAMLYRTPLTPDFKDGRLGFRDGDTLVPVDRFESIPALSGKRGYFRALAGFGLPYAQWIGRDLDLCRAYCFCPPPRSLSSSIRTHAVETAQFSADPLLKYLYARWERTSPYIGYYRQLHAGLREDVEWVLAGSPRRTFAVLHYCLPHKPYLFNEDGSERPTDPEMTRESLESYERHLACLDVRIGEFLDLLREAGRLDESLVIITSDHSWRADPLRRTGEHPITHVPLIVKLPHQRTGLDIHERFENYHLGDIIAEVLGETTSPGYQSAIPAEWKHPRLRPLIGDLPAGSHEEFAFRSTPTVTVRSLSRWPACLPAWRR